MPSVKKQPARAAKPAPIKRRDRERTRQEILDIAFEEFAENGLSGGNTDAIAARANITKRLIFYYFNSKEELFTAVLEMAYAKMRAAEEDLHLEALTPEAAIRRLAEFTFDFHHANPEFVRLVSIENIHRGRHIGVSQRLKEMTQPSINQIAKLLAHGVAGGVIRPEIDPVELHMTLNALSFFSVANRHTFEAQFAWDMSSSKARTRRRAEIADLLWRYVRKA
ncbi:TetR/AcrR family transcriptional regulator [Bradyrhizobium sp. BWA-3-5]|uniref:TetR/AcrR family transcriptional regulator n=1 Tax=Bradyrhizobium sp. BWA-3-5 TaxID=3080013 RepID=UPI00293E24ED|nr:TetR/AcrR family transcriptional regulator [Bradyrhizobium sp. BWA-3-5]WOH69471.1 TetR/AcrR family transcriptional regulator [Bradyrhizobium sp. BWA-3-5]